jgi:putative ABC transport system permease protein
VFFNSVTPAYFATLRVPLVAGRAFERRDATGAPLVAIVSEAFAKQFFNGQNPVGQRLLLSRMEDRSVEIVGVAAEIRHIRSSRAREGMIYVPFAQSPASESFVLVRHESDALALLPVARKKVAEVDREQPIFNAKLMDDWLNERLSPFKIVAAMATGFGLLALALAAIGLYGVVAFSVSQRTREIGIRAALGADPTSLLRMVLRQGYVLLVIGLVPGLLAAWVVMVWLKSATQEIAQSGPMTGVILTAVIVLALAALIATLIPARRAASIDPIQAIRYE